MRLPRARLSPFGALVQAIVYQQLAGAAARAIHGRLLDAMGGEVTPDALLASSDETLRAVGLSAAKVRSLRDLATKVLDGTVVVSPRSLARQSDEEVTATADNRARHRPVVGRHVSHVPAAPARRVAGRRLRRTQRLRAGLEGPDADGARARAAR